jgi:hypothetical protein
MTDAMPNPRREPQAETAPHSPPRLCPACTYDLTGIESDTCPECGGHLFTGKTIDTLTRALSTIDQPEDISPDRFNHPCCTACREPLPLPLPTHCPVCACKVHPRHTPR